MGAGCGKGGHQGSAEELAQCNEIERFLRESKRKMKQEIKILILGAGDSGKTTICKQFQMINNEFTAENRLYFKTIIQASVVDYMKTLLRATDALGRTVQRADLAARLLEGSSSLTPAVADTIATLWEDPAVKDVYAQRNQIYILPDCSAYLFGEVKRLAEENFVPTEDDCLRARIRTTGIIEYNLNVNNILFKILDVGGQRNERRKWLHCFEDVKCLLYCAALDDYNLSLVEDLNVNRMKEAVKLFNDVVSLPVLAAVPIIFFFNKSDLLKEKIERVTPEVVYPDYQGGHSYEEAAKFIQHVYMRLLPEGRTIYPHVTCALDRKNIKFVWDAVRHMVTSDTMKGMGM